MKLEPGLHLPAKARLTWRISRLRLDASNSWVATGYKGSRVSIIPLPSLENCALEETWLAELEASFEAHAFDPTQHPYLDSGI